MLRVLAAYALSGFISLGYQVAWFRIFMDWFGSTALTFAVVVANFIGGLGLGAWLSRRLASQLATALDQQDGLRTYGTVELLVGVAALLTIAAGWLPPPITGQAAYALATDGLFEPALLPTVLQWLIGIVCVFLPCLFMGVTFPLLCDVYRASADRRFPSRLYAWNTAGACSGVLAMQFLLLPAIGHGPAFVLMAALNIALGAWFLLSGGAPAAVASSPAAAVEPGVPVPSPAAPTTPGGGPAVNYPVMLACAMLSGFLAGALEGDLFKRIAFAVQLNPGATMSFISFWAILGIFLASALVRHWRGLRLIHVQLAFVVALALYASLAQLPLIDALIHWLQTDVFPAPPPPTLPMEFATALPFPANLWQLLLLTGALTFPAFFLVALLLPYACNRVQQDDRHLGLAYGANTLAFCAGLVLFTLLAPQLSIFFSTKLFLVYFLLATLLLLSLREQAPLRPWAPALAGLLAVAAWLVVPADFDRGYFDPRSPSARYRIAAVASDANHTIHVVDVDEATKFLYFGRLNMSATNLVAQAYMRQMAHLPLLAQDDPRRALLIAYGVGNTASAIASHQSIEQIDIVDLNAKVFEVADEFLAFNDGVLRDPRVRRFHDDGRHFLRVMPGRYDLITSEPPPPMAAGVYRLYSREYYADALAHLTDSGYMSQWLPIYQMPPEAVALAIRSFVQVFPHSFIFTGWSNNFILVGGRKPLDPTLLLRRYRAGGPAIANLRRGAVGDEISLLARLTGSDVELRERYGQGRVISDQHNDLELMLLTPVDSPGLPYDPLRVNEDFGLAALDTGGELPAVMQHLGRLRYRVAGFPFESFAKIPPASAQRLRPTNVDWLAVRLTHDEYLRALPRQNRAELARLLRRLLSFTPEQPEFLLPLARLELQGGRPTEAAGLLRQFVVLEQKNAEGHYLLGLALRNAGDADGALAAWSRAAELAPRWPAPLNDMAWLLAAHPDPARRDPARAISLAEQALSLAGRRDPNLLDTLAAAEAAAGDFERATALIDEALAQPGLEPALVAMLRSRQASYAAREVVVDPALAGPVG